MVGRSDINPFFGHWLAGFIDGEGCFTFARSTYNGAPRDRPRFQLFLRDDDSEVIESIHAITGIGVVRLKKAQQRTALAMGKPQIGWIVDSRADLRKLIGLVDQFPLRSKKARDYVLWREGTMLWINSDQRYRSGSRGREPHECWEQIAPIRDRLAVVRTYDKG